MAFEASSDGNFNTMNPEEAVRVIENLASNNSTKDTDFERKRSAAILGNDQMVRSEEITQITLRSDLYSLK